MPTLSLTRRKLMKGMAASLVSAAWTREARATSRVRRQNSDLGPYPPELLPRGVRSRFVANVNGLRMHVLEAGEKTGHRAGVLLIHGFPELAYSWRNVMPRLAAAGYHVIAPDLRGYGRTDGTDVSYDDDLRPFRMLNEVRDMLGLVSALGYQDIHLVGHDFGSLVASWCAIARPDVFRSVVLMSAPFGGTAALPFDTAGAGPAPMDADAGPDIDADLMRLTPPRKHYRRFFASRQANDDMWRAPQGVHAFLRAYYHMKSGDWTGNRPHPLREWSAAELAQLPHYYVMELDKGMAETVAEQMPSPAEIVACDWLSDEELSVYSAEYDRTGFQGGLQWYRSVAELSSIFSSSSINADLQVFAGRTIDQPSLFVGGKSDWGIYQRPGALDRMRTSACSDLRGVHLLDGAGHWVQQEQSEKVGQLLVAFMQPI